MKPKKYRVTLSEKDIQFLRDCIEFQFEMSGYDDPFNWEMNNEPESQETINKLTNMENKLKNIVCPRIKIDHKGIDNFTNKVLSLMYQGKKQ